MINSSDNFTPRRPYSPFQAISWLWKGASSISPASSPSTQTVGSVALNSLNRTESYDELQVLLDLSERIKPPSSQFCAISPSPSIAILTDSPSFSPAPLKRTVSFNETVEALLIPPRQCEPTAEEISKHIEREWDKGNLSITPETARKAIIKKEIKIQVNKLKIVKIVKLKLLK